MMECEICGAGGLETPATKKVLGKDACDQCAAELEDSLQIGPPVWLVTTSFGFRNYADADEYAKRVGGTARQGFIVDVVGGDEADVLAAAGFAYCANFGESAGVPWPHDDEEGLRERLLHGAEA